MARSRTILYVDNNDLNRLVVVRHLADSDLLVAQARSPEEALSKLEHGNYGATIISLEMPGASELIGTLRDRIPAVLDHLFVFTGAAESPFARVSEDQFTPFDLGDLLHWIESLDRA